MDFSGDVKVLRSKKAEYRAKSVIVAIGAFPRPIGCEREREFSGKGVSYCATCDGNFFEDMEIYVVGGGDTACEEACYLTRFGRKVTIIHRRDALRACKSIQEKSFNNPQVAFMWDSVVTAIDGDGLLERMTVKNVKTGELTTIEAHEDDGTFGLFGFIGYTPNSTVVAGVLDEEFTGATIAAAMAVRFHSPLSFIFCTTEGCLHMYSVLKGTAYFIAHTPEMVIHNGTTQTTQHKIDPSSEYLSAIRGSMRSYEDVLAY